MKLIRSHRKLKVEMSIAPLVDIVLLLIVFCMTVTQLTKSDTVELDLPEGREGIGLGDIQPERLVINILKDGILKVHGMDHTLSMIDTLLDQSVESIVVGRTTVVLRCDRAVPWEQVARLARMCTEKSIYRVRVTVRDPDPV